MAQSASLQMGARANGMANAASCLSDVWSMTSNIAGLSSTTHVAASFSYHAVPSFKPFNRLAAAFALPIATGVAGMSVFRFGDDLYNEHAISMGYANTFGLASLGLKVNYIQYRAEALGSAGALTVSFGGIATLTPELKFGAYIVNLNQPVINRITEERIPTTLMAGVAYGPSEKVTVVAEVEKELEHAPYLKAGVEYQVHKKISFRTGFHLNPQTGFFGLGFKSRKFDLDYALQFNGSIGTSHQATVTCQFSRP